mmetsp:Transcript_23473/g.54759  ORF Transcript_23473/g.54759 Transcript_23473/m.54759 type:complete len:475 (-) Transcript_23473:97-1521(-)|eukprot:CAMPEP_0178424652 /NCGR_PEP_ID=MMETSP0689_2-20121128/28320_1 /TAXON_ID=160604 /ORGANISM="Amphidinium massartii, Strain CS-259" /LENGTH=474 /DNA_ID=CAMNT_0020046295 /DNA_START=123 /DNA_END=1547 /DNA_ORIENTATION=+
MAMPAEDKSVQQMQATGARIVQSTPGLAEKLVSASRTQLKGVTAASGSGSPGGRDDRDAMIMDLQRQLDSEKEKNRSLEDQVKYRIASFVKRETQTKNKIESLERRLNEGMDDDEHLQRMGVIENMHKCVQGGLDCIQTNTAKILQEQEKDLMRAFRARLQEVSKELEAQRSRKGEHATELQARHRRVVAELHEAQELAQTFDKKNQQLASENQKLTEKLRTREDDRQCLLRQLVIAKKEIARLKALCKEGGGAGGDRRSSLHGAPEQAPAEAAPSPAAKKPFTQKQIDQAKLQDTRNRQYEREVKYREAVTRLRRMVEAERRKSEVLKKQQAEMLQQRTELEVLLRQCLYDVKSEIMRYRADQVHKDGGPKLPTSDETYAAMSVHDLKPQDRERVLELLLSQQRVVQLLYSKTFPTKLSATPGEEEVSASATAPPKEDEFAWLSDIIPDEGKGDEVGLGEDADEKDVLKDDLP